MEFAAEPSDRAHMSPPLLCQPLPRLKFGLCRPTLHVPPHILLSHPRLAAVDLLGPTCIESHHWQGVAVIELTDPSHFNAFGEGLATDLGAAVAFLDARVYAGGVVLQAAGSAACRRMA